MILCTSLLCLKTYLCMILCTSLLCLKTYLGMILCISLLCLKTYLGMILCISLLCLKTFLCMTLCTRLLCLATYLCGSLTSSNKANRYCLKYKKHVPWNNIFLCAYYIIRLSCHGYMFRLLTFLLVLLISLILI